jgi:hypothetical protein
LHCIGVTRGCHRLAVLVGVQGAERHKMRPHQGDDCGEREKTWHSNERSEVSLAHGSSPRTGSQAIESARHPYSKSSTISATLPKSCTVTIATKIVPINFMATLLI